MARIVEINTSCNYGSTGHIEEAIGKLAVEQGHEVLIAHGGRYVNPSQLPTFPIQPKWMDYVHYVLGSVTGKQGQFSTYYTKRFVKKLKAYQPNIIHLHNIHGYYLDYRVLFHYLQEANIPVVWTLHDCWPLTGHCAYYATETGVCEQWKTSCQHCPKLRDYPRVWLDRVHEEHALKKELIGSLKNLTIVPVSRWMEDNVKQSFLGNKKTTLIHNGIDLNVFYARPNRKELCHKWGIEEDKFVLLGVASHWNKRKGYKDILSLSDIEGTKLILVGVTKQQKQRLPEGVMGIESTENTDELAELYSLANAFVNPTYSDTFPTTNLEAQACGTPVLTYNTDGSPETLTNQTGCIVPKGDRKALRVVIEKWQKNNPFDRETIQQFAHKRYNKNERFQEYITLYNRLL